jgi:hypothetical protein
MRFEKPAGSLLSMHFSWEQIFRRAFCSYIMLGRKMIFSPLSRSGGLQFKERLFLQTCFSLFEVELSGEHFYSGHVVQIKRKNAGSIRLQLGLPSI